MKQSETHDELLLLGMVAQIDAAGGECTPYLAAKLAGVSHVTARKRLLVLERNGLLGVKLRSTTNGFHKAVFTLTEQGMKYLRDNRDLFVTIYLVYLLI